MTPAQKLAKVKQRQRPKRNGPAVKLKTAPVWECGIVALREALNLSMKDVASAIGMSMTAVFQIEHGCDPMLTSAVRLAAFYGKPIEKLWHPIAKREKEQTP